MRPPLSRGRFFIEHALVHSPRRLAGSKGLVNLRRSPLSFSFDFARYGSKLVALSVTKKGQRSKVRSFDAGNRTRIIAAQESTLAALLFP